MNLQYKIVELVAFSSYIFAKGVSLPLKEASVPKPNTKFDLSPEDMELIETALQRSQTEDQTLSRKVHDLLGRLHNQKVFYRPNGPYVSG